MASCETYDQVSNEGVFSFPAPVAHHDSLSMILGQEAGIDSFAEGTNLVGFKEKCRDTLFVDGFLNSCGVGHEQVIADDLDFLS